ncbi:hypothetical protein GQX73_g1417 [Xylaria multiplex]|uniref:ER-bound oxygenase mpaB/mpaB'/Rubber oxygenase catalytic domain-containing protein n=1 Tax=Xylaria multiplex TaxID=323545 RepID=A0A7C8MRW6_9PEZI|nr:hypothetical protein GQX73_g1417 [Xylaria multiplex]
MSHTKEDAAVEEEQAFLSPSSSPSDAVWSEERKGRDAKRYLRLGLEISMAIIIILLSAYILHERVATKSSPVPKFPRKIYKFLPDSHYASEDMLFDEEETLSTLHNWLPLSSDARGYVQVPNYASYDTLANPYIVALDRTTDGPAYMMSVFHQLHCLSYIVDHYQRGYAGANLTEEVAHHSVHCFDYLRQSIMCAADTNLEGDTEAGPGWGSDHQCADYDAVLAWANEHGAMKWRTGLLPARYQIPSCDLWVGTELRVKASRHEWFLRLVGGCTFAFGLEIHMTARNPPEMALVYIYTKESAVSGDSCWPAMPILDTPTYTHPAVSRIEAEGVPSIAKLVARAAQRSSSSNRGPARKPKAGLSVAPADLLGRPGAPKTRAAIDRVNYIHSLYRPSGKMSDDDLLYVLSLFALETIRWIDRFEWRCLTAEERCALATLWQALGEELRIPFEKLPSFQDGFRDPLHWLAELEDWGRQYEKNNREKSPESVFLAQKQLDAWLGRVPGCLKHLTRGLLAVLIEPGLRQAMGIETPPPTAVFLVETIIRARKFIRRHFYSPLELVLGYKHS